MTRLFHYTCAHGRKALGDHGDVMPAVMVNPDLAEKFTALHILGRLAWFTDLSPAPGFVTPREFREALGLTMNFTTCDRTRYRYRVTIEDGIENGLRPWTAVRHLYPAHIVAELEEAPGARPRHWWVADRPVPVIYERRRGLR